MLYKIFIFLSFIFVKTSGYNFYKRCDFKTLHINEPKIFENMDDDDIIAMSKRYDIPYKKRNIFKVKEDLYKIYMKIKKYILLISIIQYVKVKTQIILIVFLIIILLIL